jgi:superfamily II DNA/RNA helicase
LSFSELGLNEAFAATIHAAGYENPTELQKQLIPLITQSQSVIIWTQSASGKTGAFLIPAINYILNNPLEEHRHARILILTSRRDRVNQINYTIKRLLGDEQQIRSGFIVSGRPYQPQMRLLRRPLDLMIATPGRLNDLVDNNKADFSKLEMLIIDDLSAIYHKGLHGLINKILSERTSACPAIVFVRKEEEVTNYARAILAGAQELEVEEDKNPLLQIPQVVHLADDYTHKIALMDHLLDEFAGEPTYIFTVTNKTAKALAESLANHGHAAEVAASLAPEERDTSINSIIIYADQDNDYPVLKGDEHIINFELPAKVEDYEARFSSLPTESREEAVIAVVLPRERENLKRIEDYLGDSIEQCTLPGLAPLEHTSNFTPAVRSPRSNNGQNQRAKSQTGGQNRSRSHTGQGQTRDSRDYRESNARGGQANRGQYDKPRQDNNDPNRQQQRKGPYGRINNGGQQTRRNDNTGGNGNYSQPRRPHYPNANMQNRDNNRSYEIGDWEKKQDYAPATPQDKNAGDKKVVIRYKEKRRIITNS